MGGRKGNKSRLFLSAKRKKHHARIKRKDHRPVTSNASKPRLKGTYAPKTYVNEKNQTLLDLSTPTERTPAYADLMPVTANALRSETPIEARRKLEAEGGVPQNEDPLSASSSEPQPGPSNVEASTSKPHNEEVEPESQEYAEPLVKIEPPEDSAFTIVVQDPLTQTTLEGSYRDLFEPGAGPAADPGDSEDPDADQLVIDEPPPSKKPRKAPKPDPVPDINFYKAELTRYKKEVLEQLTEIQNQQKKISSMNEQITRLKITTNKLREMNADMKNENSQLRLDLETARAQLKAATRKIKEFKQKEFASDSSDLAKTSIDEAQETNDSGRSITESNTADLEENSITAAKQTELHNELSTLASELVEQNVSMQIINSINDNLTELMTQINGLELTQSGQTKLFVNQLISSMHTQLAKLETQIRKQEMELCRRREVQIATRAIVVETTRVIDRDMGPGGFTDTRD